MTLVKHRMLFKRKKKLEIVGLEPQTLVLVFFGMKKTLLVDQDGTFLGHPGYVLPHAEYEWDGDPRRGVGDYRIPAVSILTLVIPRYAALLLL